MKLLIALAVSLSTTVAFACTDFSGNYRSPEAYIFTIKQTDCTQVSVTKNNRTSTIIADGYFRVIDESKEAKISAAAMFQGDNLMIEMRIKYLVPFPADVPTSVIPGQTLSFYGKDAKGNLEEETTIYNVNSQPMKTEATVYQKI